MTTQNHQMRLIFDDENVAEARATLESLVAMGNLAKSAN